MEAAGSGYLVGHISGLRSDEVAWVMWMVYRLDRWKLWDKHRRVCIVSE